MSGKHAERVIEWLLPANPEVAAVCIQRSGVHFNDPVKLNFRERWLPELTDLGHYSEWPRGRPSVVPLEA